jgi:hypothetical protein
VDRQRAEVERFKNIEAKGIPDSFDYASVPSLRQEARQKLSKIRPSTVGQARASRSFAADISMLLVWLKRHGNDISSSNTVTCVNCSDENNEHTVISSHQQLINVVA